MKRNHGSQKEGRRWSQRVTRFSHALQIEEKIFTSKDPEKIARSLMKSSLASHERKASPFGAAMFMLNFYINRAGKNLGVTQKKILNQAKKELKRLFGKPF